MVPIEADHDAVHIRRPYPNENAFPYVVTGLEEFTVHPGLTKREYFAAMAMQGTISSDPAHCNPTPNEVRSVATDAVFYADALIEALQPKR